MERQQLSRVYQELLLQQTQYNIQDYPTEVKH